MVDLIIVIILIVIIGGVVYYLYREKKRGRKCIGCPYAGQCEKSKCQEEGGNER